MDTEEKVGVGCFLLVVVAIIVSIAVSMIGLHIQTRDGKHVGYITATETEGLLFKTDRAYVKTDTQSSQEDAYCVIDKDVFAQLRALADTKAHVEVSYISYFSAGIANCAGEGDIVIGVTEIK